MYVCLCAALSHQNCRLQKYLLCPIFSPLSVPVPKSPPAAAAAIRRIPYWECRICTYHILYIEHVYFSKASLFQQKRRYEKLMNLSAPSDAFSANEIVLKQNSSDACFSGGLQPLKPVRTRLLGGERARNCSVESMSE